MAQHQGERFGRGFSRELAGLLICTRSSVDASAYALKSTTGIPFIIYHYHPPKTSIHQHEVGCSFWQQHHGLMAPASGYYQPLLDGEVIPLDAWGVEALLRSQSPRWRRL
jgi:hypothetical protein